MAQQIEIGGFQENQWDWQRIQRNPLNTDAAYASLIFLTPTASAVAYAILGGLSGASKNVYIKRITFSSDTAIGWTLATCTGISSQTTNGTLKLGQTSVSNTWKPGIVSGTPSGIAGFDQGFCAAADYLEIVMARDVCISSGHGLLVYTTEVAANVTVAIAWAEYND